MTKRDQKSSFRCIFPASFRRKFGLNAMLLKIKAKLVGTEGFEPSTPTTPFSRPERLKNNENNDITPPPVHNLTSSKNDSNSISDRDHYELFNSDPEVRDRNDNLIDFDVALDRMDAELLAIIEAAFFKPRSAQKLYNRYVRLHRKKYNEEFEAH